MQKNILRFLITFVLSVFALSVTAYCATGTIIDGKTYVPVRGVFEELGFDVSYDSATATATISNGTYTINVPKDKTYFMVNGNSIKPDSPQKIVNGSLYLPLRAIADSIGAATSWDGNNKVAHISFNGKDSYVSCKAPQQSAPVSQKQTTAPAQQSKTSTYILNTNTKKFHYPTCSSVKRMSEKNKRTFDGTRDEVISQGYDPCKNCNP